MSSDTVDDLHEAEDTIGQATQMLRDAARDVHLAHARQPFEECRKEACVRLRAELAELEGYCRPSCYEEGGVWACGGDGCGCPAEHPPSHNAEPEMDPVVARLTS